MKGFMKLKCITEKKSEELKVRALKKKKRRMTKEEIGLA